MSTDPINTAPLQQFIQQVKQAEASRAREVRLDITQSKNLAFALGEVMSRLHGDLEKMLDEKIDKLQADQVIKIDLDSGGDWQ